MHLIHPGKDCIWILPHLANHIIPSFPSLDTLHNSVLSLIMSALNERRRPWDANSFEFRENSLQCLCWWRGTGRIVFFEELD